MLAKDTLEYFFSHESDLVRNLRSAEGILGDKISEKESDEEVGWTLFIYMYTWWFGT